MTRPRDERTSQSSMQELLPLDGVFVVDLTSNVAGPFATLILADLGAEVVKVERPGRGDDTRWWGPPFVAGNSVTNASLNRNKRSVVLDLQTDEGMQGIRRLLAHADVFVHNLRPGVVTTLRLDPESVCGATPGLIYCEMTGFGGKGPLGAQAAYDPLVQAFSGLLRFNTQPSSQPSRIPVSILDKGMGLWAAIGVIAALFRRNRTGQGGLVETSLVETAACWLSSQLINYLVSSEIPAPAGSRTAGIAPYQVFRAKDGELMITAGNEALWRRLCLALDASDLLDRHEFRDNPSRVAHTDLLEKEIEARLANRTVEEALQLLREASVPASPLNSIGDFAQSEQLAAMKVIQAVATSEGEQLPTIGSALRFSGVRPGVRFPPPTLGDANERYLHSTELDRNLSDD